MIDFEPIMPIERWTEVGLKRNLWPIYSNPVKLSASAITLLERSERKISRFFMKKSEFVIVITHTVMIGTYRSLGVRLIDGVNLGSYRTKDAATSAIAFLVLHGATFNSS